MFELNLPPCNPKIRLQQGKKEVFDTLRKKWVALTPEEWVRQHFTSYLINERGYPAGRMVQEAALCINGFKKRCDTVIYNENLQPLVIIEYKAPDVKISQKVFDQIAGYNIALKVKYLFVSNGLKHFGCFVNYENQEISFLKEIPAYKELTEEGDAAEK